MRGTRKSLEQISSENYLNVTKNTTPTIRVRHLLAAASVSALALALPGPAGIYGTRAWAQALPPGCEDETGDTTANDGEIIECEGDPTNGNLDPVITDVDDLTLILGSETASIDLFAPGGSNENGVTMSGSGPQSLTIKNVGSAIYGQNDGVSVTVEAGGVASLDNLTIVSEGQIEARNTGINAANSGAGDTSITTYGLVLGTNSSGIYVYSDSTAGDVTIDASDKVEGGTDAIYVNSHSDGNISIDAGELDAGTGAGVKVRADTTTDDITIVLNDDVEATTGVYVQTYGQGALQIDANKIDAIERAIFAETETNTTTATLNLNGLIQGENGIDLFHRGNGDATVTLGTEARISAGKQGLPGEALELTTTNAQSLALRDRRRRRDDQCPRFRWRRLCWIHLRQRYRDRNHQWHEWPARRLCP